MHREESVPGTYFVNTDDLPYCPQLACCIGWAGRTLHFPDGGGLRLAGSSTPHASP